MTLDLTKPYPHVALNIVYHLNQVDWVKVHDRIDYFNAYDHELSSAIARFDTHVMWSWNDIGQAMTLLPEEDAFQLRRRLIKIEDEITSGLLDFLEQGRTLQPRFGAQYPPRLLPSQLYDFLKQVYIASALPPDRLAELLHTDDVDNFKVMVNTGEFPVTILSSDRSNLLHGVAQHNAVAIGRYLLENYDLNHQARNEQGMTPLMTAVHRGHVAIAQLLVEFGSPILLKFQHKLTLLDLAYFSLNDTMVSYVKDIAPSLVAPHLTYREILFWMDSRQEDRIIAQVTSGELALVVLNERRQKVHVLTLAISYNLPNVVKFLVEHYPLVNEPLDEDGVLPIMVAVRYKNTMMIDYLLSQGARFDLDLPPMTAASMVLEHLGVESFFHYLGKGLVLHDHDESIGFYAADHGSLPLLQWYHQQGYDLHVVSPEGDSFLTQALVQHHEQIVAYLIEHSDAQVLNQRSSPIVGYAVEHGTLAHVQQLVDHGYSMEIPLRRFMGYRPLHLALLHKKNDIALYLLEQGADYRKPTKHMVYALDLARQTHNKVMIQELKTTYHAHGFFMWYLKFCGLLIAILLPIFGLAFLLDFLLP